MQKAELSHAQQRLDWEARVREVEKMACAKQQGLIEELTEAKDKVIEWLDILYKIKFVPP